VIVETPDGRTLEIYDAGDPQGVPVIVHHGTPAVGALYTPWLEDGIRLIGFDRAGYGGSTRDRGRTVASAVGDVRAIADALGLDSFATWGISGGGPHALACAALLPDRVFAAAALASPAPYDADGLDWLAGEGEMNIVEFTAALQGETAVRPLLEQWHGAMNAGGVEGMRDEMSSLLGAADAAVLAGELAEYLYAGVVDTGGVDGWLDDDLAFVAPWGFEPAAISVPVLLRHGEDDRFVSADHSRWLAERIPGAEARITPDDGHLTLYEHSIPEIHAWLVERRSDGTRS
jgi:pimeloyl-ACP methyl ester carboxylesterase